MIEKENNTESIENEVETKQQCNCESNNCCSEADETLEEAERAEDEEFEGINVKDEKEALQKELEEVKHSNSKLADENIKLSNELETIKERLLRTTAEYENHRKRTIKEKEGIYTDACADVLKEMFPVLDNLERAISVEGSVEDLKKGIEMTMRQFQNALEKLGIEEVSTDGQFDPNTHNAVMHIDDDQFGEQQIVEVFQKGYKRGDKVLRYSMVKVAN
ncbi:MAG: nucleotide exchange factor GrpE [Bacillota bacterium]|nr:nucleotide exchange factor GrpE [Bacillota bacterium]